jgi:predicted metal-dependent hydrolase
MIQQKDKVKYGTTIIPYYIIKTRRIKTSELIVDADTITVRTPYDKDKTEIQRLVLDKARWILEKQKEYKQAVPQLNKPTFEEGSTLPYLGRNYPLNILKKQSKNSIEFVNGEFVFRLKSSKNSNALIQKLYQDWLIENAHYLFKDKVDEYSQNLGVVTIGIAIKNLKNRWGSLTKDGAINLNVNLLKAPEDVIDYIILHELCHLKIKEHSHHYWDLVHKYMPNYEEKIYWLKVNGANLI